MNLQGYIRHIQQHIKGARVLDVGCLATYEEQILKRHNQYKEAAAEIIGLDFNKEFLGIAQMGGAKDLYYCDITNRKDVEIILKQFGKFDHVIATDLIEHVGNLTLFLDNAKSLMTEKGYLYLTTPNSLSPAWMAMKLGHIPDMYNADHICWFDLNTLESLLKRSGLSIASHTYCVHERKDKRAATIFKLDWESWMGRRLYVIVEKETKE